MRAHFSSTQHKFVRHRLSNDPLAVGPLPSPPAKKRRKKAAAPAGQSRSTPPSPPSFSANRPKKRGFLRRLFDAIFC